MSTAHHTYEFVMLHVTNMSQVLPNMANMSAKEPYVSAKEPYVSAKEPLRVLAIIRGLMSSR